MQRQHLQKLSREELIREAERAGVPRPRVLTQAELIDEILKRAPTGDRERARARGWLGRARDLLATVVEKGLHLPDAAAAIRGGSKGWPPPPPPLPTVTLAEIYAAQGHLQRAVEVLDEVLRREPEHDEARELRERFLAQLGQGAAPAPPPAPSDQGSAATPTEEGEASTEPSQAAPETAAETTAPAGAAPQPPPVSVPPTMPAVEAREQGTTAAAGDGAAPPNEPSEDVGAAEDVPESENAVKVAPHALATPPSVVTTSRSPSASPPPGETAPLVVVLAHQDAPVPSAEPSSTLDAEPPSPSQEEALADTAPAEPALARAIAAATEAAALEPEAAALEPEAAALEPEAVALEAEAAALEPEAAALEPEAAALEPEAAALEAEAPAAAAAPPARYDVDEVVAIAVDPSTFYVYWEVRPTTFAHMVAASPEGSLALRVTAVTPGWDGPIVESRDIRIDALYGDRFVHHVRPRADVRVSVGWLADGKFDPIAVGAEVSAPRAFVAAGAPAPAGAPLDLSEGPHGPGPQMAGPPPAAALAAHVRAVDRLAAGLQPRDLHGVSIEEPNGRTVGWVWAAGHAGSSEVVLAFGPIHDEPSPAERAARSGAEGTWWHSTSESPRYGGASEGGPWGGASEGGPWGGASEGGAWGGASDESSR